MCGWLMDFLPYKTSCKGIGKPTSRQCVDGSSLFYRTRHLPGNRESHITAVCGWFKSFLPNEPSSGESGIPHHGSVWFVQVFSTKRAIFKRIGNPTSRQFVVRSSLFYRTRHHPENRESHITAVCGWFKSFLPNEASSGESGIPHHGSVWMVQVFSTERGIFRRIGNPTSRQCVVRSSLF